VRSTVDQILRTNVNQVATNRLGRVDGESLVLMDLEDGELVALVDDTLINSVRDTVVDELSEQDTVTDGSEELVAVGIDGKVSLQVRILTQTVIDPRDKLELVGTHAYATSIIIIIIISL